MRSDPRIIIVEWEAWDQFLLPYILPSAVRITIDPLEHWSASSLTKQIDTTDVICFQINLSCLHNLPFDVPDLARFLRQSGVKCINARCLDITKRRLHQVLDACQLPSLAMMGPCRSMDQVIVKTNLNHGGLIEKRFADTVGRGTPIGRLIHTEVGPQSYTVLPARDVPSEVYADLSLAVERFITNADGYFYRLYFAGDRRVAVKSYCPGPIKKICGDERDENYAFDTTDPAAALSLLPESVVKCGVVLPLEMDAEFGCIDLVVDDDGMAYAVDFNVTPWAGVTAPPEDVQDFLREGLASAFGSSGAKW